MKMLLFFLLLAFMNINLHAQTDQRTLADQYMQLGEVQKAVDIYQKLYSENRNNYYDSYRNGLIRLGKFDTAITITKEMIQADPGNNRYVVALGDIYTKKGDTLEANDIYTGLLKKMPADQKAIEAVASQFSRIHNNQFEIKTYTLGRSLLKKDQIFARQLGDLYRYENEKPQMLQEYLVALQTDPKLLTEVKRDISATFSSNSDYDLLNKALQKATKENPADTVYADLWAWQFLQQKKFDEAIKQAIVLNQQQKGTGNNILDLCETLDANEAYDAAIQGYQYLIGLGKSSPLYEASRIGLVNTKYLKYSKAASGSAELISLEKDYLDVLAEFGQNKTTAPMMKDLAKLQAFQLNNPAAAEKTLSDLIAIPDLPPDLLSTSKLELGDVYLLNGRVWDATLTYSQVEKAFPGTTIGYESQFRNAKLSYYMGDFAWAKQRLSELIVKTSEYINNDALNLWLMIGDHTAFDSTGNALKMFARADFLLFKGKTDSALNTLDSIDKTYPLNDLKNDILMAKARISIQKDDYQSAVLSLNKIVSESPTNLWADDAVFMLGDICQYHLQDPKSAQNWYQKILTDYPESLWVSESRKRFRLLRGDGNVEP